MRILSAAALSLALAATAAADDPSAQANLSFLQANAKKPGVVSVPGIQYRAIKSGKGAQPDGHDCATVYYKGSLIGGKVFDQTSPGQPRTFPVGRLIAGWTEALQMMHEGDEWELIIPAGLAYGKSGVGNGVIPPDSTLVFDLTLVKLSKPEYGQCG